MRLTILFLFVGLMQVSASLYSQTSKVTLNLQKSSIENVLKEIEQQTEYRFAYNTESIDLNRMITIDVNGKPISEVLDEIFEGTSVKYRLEGRHVLLYSTEENGMLKTYQQQVIVKGQVKDSTGNPLPGVTVVIKGTAQGTITDVDGNYIMTNISSSSILVFSFVGMASQEIPLNGKSSIDVVMSEDAIGLEEVVAIGYGTMKKSDLTGSVSSVRNEDLESVPVYNIEQALKSQAAGVTVKQNSGKPGGRIEVTIRGGNSMIGDNQPLYVVDGFPITGDINFLNPSDIESMDILKDASATAIYGARGANGVVIITSKRGKAGQKSRIEVNSMFGIATESNRYEMLDAKQYAEVANEWMRNSGNDPYFDLSTINNPGTNWQDLIFQNGMINNHTLTFSGSTDKSKFSVSGNFYDQEGIIKYSGVKKGTFRLNLDHEFNKFISLSVNVNLARSEIKSLPIDNTGDMITSAMSAAPTLQAYNEDGSLVRVGEFYPWGEATRNNPAIYFPPYKDRDLQNAVIGNTSLNINITKELSLKSLFGLEYKNTFGDNFSPIIFPNDRGYGSQTYQFRNSALIENVLTYAKTFSDNHKLNVVGGYTYQTFNSRYLGIYVNGFSNNTTENYNLSAAETIGNPSSGYSEWTLESWLGRANYSFKDKYILTASVRADGSSRFGANNKWGIFPSGAIAWRVSDETFMENVPFINSLKARASYGITGNTALSPYQSLDRFTSVKTIYDDHSEVIGFVPAAIANNDLKWESTAQLDIGLDLNIFNNRLRFIFDYYKKNTSNLLASVPLPPSIGFGSSLQNIGEIQNSGFELSLAADILRNDFKWDISTQFSTNKNEVVELAGGNDIYAGFINLFRNTSLARVGEPLGVFYGLLEDGLDDEGNYKYVDLKEDGEITDLDKTIIGSPYPDFMVGFSSNFSWKNFDLNFLLEGVYGNDIIWATSGNYLNSFQRGSNQLADLYGNYWTEENPDPNAKYAKVSQNSQVLFSDRFVKDGSYIRLKSLRLAYNLPTKEIGLKWLNGAQIYLLGTNLFTITNYPGIDPDVNSYGTDSQDVVSRLAQGVDATAYPSSKVYSIGFKLNF